MVHCIWNFVRQATISCCYDVRQSVKNNYSFTSFLIVNCDLCSILSIPLTLVVTYPTGMCDTEHSLNISCDLPYTVQVCSILSIPLTLVNVTYPILYRYV